MKKDEKIEEAEIKTEVVETVDKVEEPVKKPVKKKGKKIAFVIILIILTTGTGLIIWAAQTGKLDFITKIFNPQSNSQVELKRTDSVAVKSEGVYVTDVSDVVEAVMPSIVAITSKTVIDSGMFGWMLYGSSSYVSEGAGSGVIVAENGDDIFILTNYHVVEDASELSVRFIDDKSYDAIVKGVSKRKDIAIVAVKKSDLSMETLSEIKLATIGNSDELKVGNGVIAIGNALGYGQSVTTGVVSALNREVSTDLYVQDMIQIDAAINGGNSGGALLNSKGEVVGINSAKYSANASSSMSIEGMSFAIPMSVITPMIDQLINGQDDEELSLGIQGYMTTSGAIANYKLPDGFYVSAIASGSNADKSELEIGNIITTIDGVGVTSIDTIKKVVNKKEKGSTVVLKVKYASRNEYKEKEISVALN